MAAQKENGYTPIANELLEQIYVSKFNATQLKILLLIMRYTYGFSRKQHDISIGFISRGTGISRRYISEELRKLIDWNVVKVVKNHTEKSSRILAINKYYKQWGYGRIVPQVKNSSTGEELFTTTGEQLFHRGMEEYIHKDKQNIKQNIKQGDSDFFDKIWELYPKKKGKGKVSPKKKKELHKIGYETLKKCIERYIAENKNTEEQYLQYGSTFFNSGYVDYLDENYNESIEQPDNDNTVVILE